MACDVPEAENIIDTLLSTIKEQIYCQKIGEHIFLNLPFTFPSGDFISLHIINHENKILISDGGEILKELDILGKSKDPIIDEIKDRAEYMSGLGISKEGEITKVSNMDSIGTDMIYMIDLIKDLGKYLKPGPMKIINTFKAEVKVKLEEWDLPFEEDYKYEVPDRTYKVDFYIPKGPEEIILNLFSPGSPSSITPTIEHLSFMWHDLKTFKEDILKGYVIIDNEIIENPEINWKDKYRKILQRHSDGVFIWEKETELLHSTIQGG